MSADQKVNIALETMAGKGSEVGRSFDELARIIDKVDHNDKLTVCFDTCHAHDAGYDIVNDFDGVMEEFDRIIGLDRLAVLHINDSKNFRGARKDRHAPVGSRLIGFETIYNIVHHDVAKGKPVILETPWIGKEKATKRPMYEAEIALLSDNAEKRFGERFLDDVEKLKSFFNKQSIQPQEFVAKTWEALKGQKQKNADKREPMERLYDLVVSEQLFKDYTEEAINHRLIAVLAERK